MAIPMAVTVGAESDRWVAVTSGNIALGTEVVILGNENIAFPQPVAISDPAELTLSMDSPTPNPEP